MEVARGVFLRCPWTHGRRRDARWPALVLLAVLAWPDAASADLSWPLSDYNPRSLPDDLLLPLPCGGAMAFRPVPTGGPPGGKANLPPGLHWLLDVQGSFPGGDGQGAYFLMGKYEVNARQYRAVRAAAEGRPCPAVAAAASALPMVDIRRADAAAFAEALSAWWVEQAKTLPDCAGGASPCLPRLDETAPSARLPTEAEWEYALRGGNRVSSAEFAARRYPMPNGLARSAWYRDNARELRGIGLRDPNPLGLHDMLGNAEEILADNYRGPRGSGPVGGTLVRGGSAWSPAEQLDSNRRIEQPTYNHTEDTGFRVLAYTPVNRTAADARRHSGQPGEGSDSGPTVQPPVEPRPGALTVRVDPPATLWLDDRPLGRFGPARPLRLRDLPAGEYQLRARIDGQPDVVETIQADPGRTATLDLHLPPSPAVPPNRPAKPKLIPPRWAFEPAMIALPGGTLLMGSPDTEPERDGDEGPRRSVVIAPFAIGRTEITRGQYRVFAEARQRAAPPPGDDDLPMADVSWHDARDYATWLSQATGRHYRLPTEAEWEYATRAGTPTPFWTGNCIDTSQANYNGWFDYAGCGAETGLFRNAPVPAGSLPANPFGLHEVHGNLGEWTADCWRDSLVDPVGGDPAAVRQDCSRHVLRGGFFDHKPHLMRSANRFGVAAGIRREDIGFRVARDL
jgi:formylglycine-generating enzyme required for sulfatase activity